MLKEPIRLPKKAEVVARKIAASIVDRGLAPGTLMPNEVDMQSEFGVARSTLREALRLLETQGVLSLQAGRGPTVRRPTADNLVNSLTLLLQFHDATFKTLLDARVLFEPQIAGAAAQLATARDLERLRVNVAAAHETNRSVAERVRLEIDFHRILADASQNQLASILVATITSTIMNEIVDIQVDHDFARDIQYHQDILDAVDQRDAPKAERLMRVHLQDLVSMVSVDHPALLKRPIRWI